MLAFCLYSQLFALFSQDHPHRKGQRVKAADIAHSLRFRREQAHLKRHYPPHQA